MKRYYNPNKYIIANKQRASEYNIKLIEGLNGSSFLIIDESMIPSDKTVDNFLKMLENEQIIEGKHKG